MTLRRYEGNIGENVGAGMAHDDIYKEHFFHEMSRRDSLNGSLNFPVGLVTLVGGALYVMATKLTPPFDRVQLVMASVLVLSALCLLIASYLLVRAWWGYTYKGMPLSNELRQYRKDLAQYFVDAGHPPTLAESLAANKFCDDIDAEYAINCRINSLNNDRKSAYLFKANGHIIGAIALAIVATPLFIAVVSTAPTETTQKIEIVNLKDLAMPNEQQQGGGGQQQEKPAPVTPVMPTMPPSRDIKENVVPPHKK